MDDTGILDREWRASESAPFYPAMTFTDTGVTLGWSTLLAAFSNGILTKEEHEQSQVFRHGHEARVLTLLAAAYDRPIAESAVEKIRHAGKSWRGGQKTLAKLYLGLIGLPRIDEADAHRLFLAEQALDKGTRPGDLMKALGFPEAALDLEKYNPDQPRVPAGSGRESGRWTPRNGGGQQYAQAGESTPSIRRLHPDETYETDPRAKRSLEYWRQRTTNEIIESLQPDPGNREGLTVKPDGIVVQGNTRLKVLEERGLDVNSLPRAILNEGLDQFLPQLRVPGGGGSTKDKKYPLEE